MGLVEISFLSFAFLGLLLAIFFFFKKKGIKQANIVLGIYLSLFSYNILFNCLYWSELLYSKTYIHFFYTNFFPWLSYGPLFYLYILIIIKKKKIAVYDIFHFIPLLLLIIGRLPLYSLNAETKLTVLRNNTWANHGYSPKVISWLIVLQLFLYGIASLYILKKNLKFLNQDKKIWLRFFVSFFFGYWIAFTSYFVLSYFNLITKENDYFIGYLIVFFIGMVSYFGLMQPEVFNGLSIKKVIPFVKYKKTGLTKIHALELKKQLLIIMENEKPFLENSLRLEDLAKRMNLSRHHMSQVVNEYFQLSFFDYINQYRVNEAKILLLSKDDDLNITQIAYTVGFNNRVSFYKAFKKFTHTTPSDYIISHANHISQFNV